MDLDIHVVAAGGIALDIIIVTHEVAGHAAFLQLRSPTGVIAVEEVDYLEIFAFVDLYIGKELCYI